MQCRKALMYFEESIRRIRHIKYLTVFKSACAVAFVHSSMRCSGEMIRFLSFCFFDTSFNPPIFPHIKPNSTMISKLGVRGKTVK